MKLIPLGVNGPFPAPGGACSGNLLLSEDGQTKILIDLGAGTLSRLEKLADPGTITAIVLTHLHYDHMADMTVLKYLYQIMPPEKNIPVLLPDGPASIRMLLEDPHLDLMPHTDLQFGPLSLSFTPAYHPVPAVSLRVTEGSQTLAVTGDTNRNDALDLFFDGADLILADCGMDEAHWTPTCPHLSAALCGRLAASCRAGQLLLTHLRPDMDQELLLKEARAFYPAAELAKPGTIYCI